MIIQLRILLGIVIWLCGVVLDAMLIPYLFILIYIGAALTFFEIVKWLMVKENRVRTKEVFGFGTSRDFLSVSRPKIGLHDLPCKQYEKIRKNSSGARGYHRRILAGRYDLS
jgi:hypothetical protein